MSGRGETRGKEEESVSERIAALTDRGLKRATNEDSVLAEELPHGSVLLAVADGVGGAAHGEIASDETVHVLHDELLKARIDDPAEALERALAMANRRLRDLSRERGEPAGMASTLVAALVRDGAAWVTNAGDSRAYLLHDGRLQQISRDHSLVAEQVRAGVLTAEEAERSEYRSIIVRGIGVDETIEPYSAGPVHLPAESVLLLCSDGLYRVVSEERIAEVLSSGTPAEMAERLIELANRGGGPDNIAVAILRSA